MAVVGAILTLQGRRPAPVRGPVAVISSSSYRLTESSDRRITEAGDPRVTE